MKILSYTKGVICTFLLLISHSVFADWADVSSDIEITKSRPAFDRVNRVYFVHLDVKNTGTSPLSGPFRLSVDNSTIPVTKQSGNTEEGVPFVDITNESITANETVRVRVDFLAQRKALTFDAMLQEDHIDPVAEAGVEQTVFEFSEVTLVGSGQARNAFISSYHWQQMSGEIVTLDDISSPKLVFMAPSYKDNASELVFELKVIDSVGAVNVDEVKINITPIASNVEIISSTIDLTNSGIEVPLDSGEFLLVTPKSSRVISSQKLPITFEKATETQLVGVVNKHKQAVMYGDLNPNTQEVTVDVETTAVTIVKMRPYFFGVKFKDDNSFSQRIKQHDLFEKLVVELTKQINRGNTCPLNPDCSITAFEIAHNLASSLNISDLVEG